LFRDPEIGFFDSLVGLIFLAVILLFGAWIYSVIAKTKTGKTMNNVLLNLKSPIMRWYDNLPYKIRNTVGVFSVITYCLVVVAFLIWLES
jgi:carbon starvation protein CstA